MINIKDKSLLYQTEKIKKNSDSIALKLPKIIKIYRQNIKQRKKVNKLNPNSNQIERRNISFLKGLNKNITIDILHKNNENFLTKKTNYQNSLSENNFIKEKILLDRPKIKIKINSLKHNNTSKNTISTEKNNQPIKCKVHQTKPLTAKHSNVKYINISQSLIKKNENLKNKRNYEIININNNLYNSKEKKAETENKEKSYINYYNIVQEKCLKDLSIHLDNLLGKKIQSQYQNLSNNVNNRKINGYNYLEKVNSQIELNMHLNENSKKNKLNTNVYRKKIQRKNNCYINTNSFSDTNFLTFDYKNSMNSDKSDILLSSQQLNCLNNNIIKTNRVSDYISNNMNNINNYNAKSNESTNINCNDKNNSILLTKSFKKLHLNNSRNYLNKMKQNTNITNIDNIKNKNLIFNNNDSQKYQKNKINNIEIIGLDGKIKDNLNTSSKIINYNSFRHKNVFILDSPRNNLISNTTNLDDVTSHSKYENSINFIHGNNDDSIYNKNKKYITLYSNNSSQYNTVNNLNITENNLFIYNNPSQKNKNLKNAILNNKNNDLIETNKISSKKIFLGDPLPKKKNMTSNNSFSKKLRNVITSIQYLNSKSDYNSDVSGKNIILSKCDENGTINIRVREVKNSIEKILRNNSFYKRKKMVCTPSQQKLNLLTYVKKNQGTHIKKGNLHNNIVSQKHYYPTQIPFQ